MMSRLLGRAVFALATTVLLVPSIVRAQVATAPAPSPAQAKPAKVESATEPAPRDMDWWKKLHQSHLDRIKEGPVDLLFLGDSITQGWNNNETWKRFYAPRKAANMGIGGDRTQHVLYRMEHGALDGIHPRTAVVMIGTNNLGANSTEEIAAGIQAIVDRLGSKLPETKVLLLGVFPRGASRDKGAVEQATDPRINEINERIKKLDDGKRVHYLDIGPKFLTAKGTISKDVMPDFLHLSPAGYRIWAEAIEPTLWKLQDEPKP
jgi:beta-glucosidase